MKVSFSDSENSKQVESELLSIMGALQEAALRLVNISHRVGLADMEGRLQGYADVISSTSGNISEMFEFYK